jgi:hypothetical protein
VEEMEGPYEQGDRYVKYAWYYVTLLPLLLPRWLAQTVRNLACIGKIPGPDVSWNLSYHVANFGFLQSFHENSRMVPLNRM